MSHSFHLSRMLRLCLLLTLLLAAVGMTTAQDQKILYTGINMVGGDPDNGLDPSLSSTVQSIQILEQMYIGLTYLNEETGDIEPGMGSWDISDDGTVYTFSIVQGVPWVLFNSATGEVEQVTDDEGNVRFVTANDFYYGIMRTINPATGGSYANLVAEVIVGGMDYLSGEGAMEDVGVVVLDDYTLQITSPEPLAFALNIFGLWMAYAQPEWVIEEYGDLWVDPQYRQSYGPFVMSEWNNNLDITLVKNPFWPGTDNIPQAKLDAVVFKLIDDAQQFAEFLAGTMQAATVPSAEIDRVKADPVLSEQYFAGSEGCSIFYGFNLEMEPFTNVNMRRAFSLAVDRESLMNDVTRDGRIPARWYTRPGITAAPSLEDFPDLGVSFDPEGAQAALEAGLAELGLSSVSDLAPFTLTYGDTQYNGRIAQAVQQMWVENLGVQVELQPLETTTYYDVIDQQAPQIFRAGWCYDYPDANSFLYDTMRSTSPFNYNGFSNAEFDSLVDRARVIVDTEERTALYARAEQILIEEEVAIVPLYYHVTRQIVAPNVVRTFSTIGYERYEKWDIN